MLFYGCIYYNAVKDNKYLKKLKMMNATVLKLRVKVVLLEIYCLKYCKLISYILTAYLSLFFFFF